MSGHSIPHHKDFFGKVSDLLSKGYPTLRQDDDGKDLPVKSSTGVSFAVKPRGDFSLKSSVTSEGTKTKGRLQPELTLSDLNATLSADYKTSGSLSAVAAFKNVAGADGLSAKLGVEAEEGKQNVTASGAYCHEHFHAHVGLSVPVAQHKLFEFVDLVKVAKTDASVHGHLVSGLPDHKVFVAAHADADVIDSKPKISKCGGDILFKDGDFSLAAGITHHALIPASQKEQKDGDKAPADSPARQVFHFGAHSTIGKVAAVADLQWPLKTGTPVLTLGAGYPLNADASVSAKVDSSYRVGFTYAHDLSAHSQLSFGVLSAITKADSAFNVQSDYAFQLSVKQ